MSAKQNAARAGKTLAIDPEIHVALKMIALKKRVGLYDLANSVLGKFVDKENSKTRKP